ncbi:transposase domain-containing protein [Microvirga subterranea]|uniref:transposase domain-containing protein n=1 Tax=Microvirga subterranea TaxID=186651 RepID=UPI003CCAE653
MKSSFALRMLINTHLSHRSPATRQIVCFDGTWNAAGSLAIITSLVVTRKMCGVDPQAYLTDVLSRIVTDHLQQPDR